MISHSVRQRRVNLSLLAVISCILVFCGPGMASSFPFRAINPGDGVPSLSFKNISDNSTVAIDSLRGNPAALVFWGADLETKKERSLKTFQGVEEILPFLQEHQVRVMLVNAQGDPVDVIRGITGQDGGMPSYIDETQKAYGDLGIFVVPSVLLIDKDGKVAAGIGYSHDFSDRLKGEVQVMLGKRTREQVEQELRPEMKEKTADEKETLRHLNTAEVMIRRGQVDSAINELQKALRINAGLGAAHGRLGCLYLEKGQLEKARAALDRSYEIDPDYLPANICDALVRAGEGRLEEAVDDLRALLFRNARNAELHYSLGTLFEKQEKFGDAAGEYRKAYELIAKEVEFE